MKAAYAKKWLLGVVWLLAGALAGYLLLVLVYCLPVQRMQKHLESCVDAFADGAAALVKDDTGTWVDYLTDSLILAQAVYRGGNRRRRRTATPSTPRASSPGLTARSRPRWKNSRLARPTRGTGTATSSTSSRCCSCLTTRTSWR